MSLHWSTTLWKDSPVEFNVFEHSERIVMSSKQYTRAYNIVLCCVVCVSSSLVMSFFRFYAFLSKRGRRIRAANLLTRIWFEERPPCPSTSAVLRPFSVLLRGFRPQFMYLLLFFSVFSFIWFLFINVLRYVWSKQYRKQKSTHIHLRFRFTRSERL